MSAYVDLTTGAQREESTEAIGLAVGWLFTAFPGRLSLAFPAHDTVVLGVLSERRATEDNAISTAEEPHSATVEMDWYDAQIFWAFLSRYAQGSVRGRTEVPLSERARNWTPTDTDLVRGLGDWVWWEFLDGRDDAIRLSIPGDMSGPVRVDIAIDDLVWMAERTINRQR
jgi:hypothetical protein